MYLPDRTYYMFYINIFYQTSGLLGQKTANYRIHFPQLLLTTYIRLKFFHMSYNSRKPIINHPILTIFHIYTVID